jgi:hypothetical protein
MNAACVDGWMAGSGVRAQARRLGKQAGMDGWLVGWAFSGKLNMIRRARAGEKVRQASECGRLAGPEGWLVGWKVGWLVGWMDGWMDGQQAKRG